ncbi:RNA demethylase ALKBH10B-like [Lotus japonicus]|uniref:RNA demethylase ALKBH10B-like n=1 Tax=Lotus japonicus TaxID=34305 RepID=UPI002583B970|nr:RNA demethylase ALKBH10B-like [Lotus japonicus]
MAAVPAATRSDHPPKTPPPQPAPPAVLVSDSYAKDAILAWYRGEFAAANAIIDALCGHLKDLADPSDYASTFAAIHRRRFNWIPVIQMQTYHSIADVTLELQKVAENMKQREGGRSTGGESEFHPKVKIEEKEKEVLVENVGNGDAVADAEASAEAEDYDSPESEITDSGSQEMHPPCLMNISICSNHEECEGRYSQMKLPKFFTARDSVKGHPVNVVKGLKLYEDIFSESEICKLSDFANEIHVAGQNGQLLGETFTLFNQQVKGNKRELIQLGVPIFGKIHGDAKRNIEPIPPFLHSVIDHLIQWDIIQEYKRPNGCIINYFEEGEFSQPFLKPPHLDQPLSTLLLSESTMAFGRILVSEDEGNYKGPLMLSLKKGSLLVMRGHSVEMAKHVMCPSPNRRVSITFFRVKPDSNQCQSPTPTMTTAMTLWQPGIASPLALPNGALSGYEAMDMMMHEWGMLGAPMVMLAPMLPGALNADKFPLGGTGVFLPWTEAPRKQPRHLSPRAQRGRVRALPPPVESHMGESSSEPSITLEG